MAKRMRFVSMLVVSLVLVSSLSGHTAVVSGNQLYDEVWAEKYRNLPDVSSFSQEKIDAYAYMDYSSASDDVKPTILATRNKIIFSNNWVADDVSGSIVAPDGTRQELPKFHDLFPPDWEIPIMPNNI